MNRSIVISILFAALSITACGEQEPSTTVVNVPAGPAGPAGAKGATGSEGAQGSQGATGSEGTQGEAGAQGESGSKGETGKPGEGTTVIVTPPAEPAE